MKLLIPLAYLNEACFLSLNIDEKKFKMCLKIAQEDLRDILGGEFNEQIETQYAPANDTFRTASATIYEDYLKDYRAWATYYRFLGFSQSESTPTGERSFKDDNSEILADVNLYSKSQEIKAMVSRYKSRIINYLQNQQDILSTNFPLWYNSCDSDFGFGISCIARDSRNDKVISITKAVTANE